MNLASFPGGGADLEEPDWAILIPDKGKGAAGANDKWRDYAHREWLRTTTALRDNGTLANENRHQIQRLVIAYVRYDKVAAEFFRLGLITKASRTGVPQINICHSEMRAADDDATKAEMELGIPPRRRGAVTKSQRKQRTGAASDTYLGQAARK